MCRNTIVRRISNIQNYTNYALIDKANTVKYLRDINVSIEEIKKELEVYLYYLEDKVDIQYKAEIEKSIDNLIKELKEI